MTADRPGTFIWARAHTYLLQCQDPFRSDVETAMLWRLLPPLVCHWFHLHGYWPLLLPWAGVVAATAYVARQFESRFHDSRTSLAATIVFTTSAAITVPVGWLGINDAWVWLGLAVTAFSESPLSLFAAGLLCPWVDERFIIGFPLALVCRLANKKPSHTRWTDLWPTFALVPYAGVRLWYSCRHPDRGLATISFIHEQLTQLSPRAAFAPLAWWLGLRAGWVAVAYALYSTTWAVRGWLIAAVIGTLAVTLVTATDLSRSVAILTPLLCFGMLRLGQLSPNMRKQVFTALAVASLVIPSAHVVLDTVDPIAPLPWELVRLARTR